VSDVFFCCYVVCMGHVGLHIFAVSLGCLVSMVILAIARCILEPCLDNLVWLFFFARSLVLQVYCQSAVISGDPL
jgi:hypothetical protein